MYVTVDTFTFTEIENLSFAPSADLARTSIPINEFQVDIHTDEAISLGEVAELYDDNGALFAHYWITHINRTGDGVLRIKAQSDASLLENITLDAVYYDNVLVSDALDGIIINASDSTPGIYAPWPYSLDSAFDGLRINGFCPQQKARERLLWVCFVIGAYIRAAFNDILEILPLDTISTHIPKSDTYWKPTEMNNDPVTAIKVKSYAFTQGTPATTDTWVTDGTNYYVVTEQEHTLTNTAAPIGTLENVVTIDGVYLVNASNVSGILTFLAQWYFNPTQIDASVINNAAYAPGDLVLLHTDDSHIVSGYITEESFEFGLQAKATIKLAGTAYIETGNLTILYVYDATQLDRKVYTLPLNYAYSITNSYIDMTMNGHRYIFRPLEAAAEGTMTTEAETKTEQYDVALDLHERILHIISVDEVTDDDGIGVIA